MSCLQQSIEKMYEFLCVSVFQLILRFIISNIESDISNKLMLFAVLSLFQTLLGYVSGIVSKKFSTKIIIDFNEKQWKKYDSMNRLSKEKDTVENFRLKLDRATSAFHSKYNWGISVLISLVSSVSSFLVIIISYKEYKILTIFVFVHSFCYFFITKLMMSNIDKVRVESREKMSNLYDISSLITKRLHYRQANVSDLIEIKKSFENISNEISDSWTKLDCTQRIPNFLVLLIIGLFVEKKLYVVLYIICANTTNSIDSFLNFLGQYKTSENDIEEFENFWKDKSFEKDCQQKLIPSYLTFSCSVKSSQTDGFSVSESNSKTTNYLLITPPNKPLTVRQGEKILISGISGAGKTTLLKALMGHIDGGFYSSSDFPLQYEKDIEYLCQSALTTVPTTKTTLRQIFYNEINNENIKEVLTIVGIDGWFRSVLNSSCDTAIQGKISGGQKTRLCLAVSLYRAKKNKTNWLVLDEPTSGVDYELCPELLKNVIREFPETTIIMIVHLCKCQLKQIGFDKEWKVSNKEVVETAVNNK